MIKQKKIRWGISLEEIGISLMFSTKKEAIKAEKDLEKIEDLDKYKVIKYCHENHIVFGYQIKAWKK